MGVVIEEFMFLCIFAFMDLWVYGLICLFIYSLFNQFIKSMYYLKCSLTIEMVSEHFWIITKIQ